MKRPKLKKASKRLSCSKRYKIQKKVREHNRKLRRDAKKKGVQKRTKKDPGVPNSAPFKEEVLREAEQRRLQIEAEKEKRRQAAKEERAQKRKKDKEAASKETEPKVKKARKEKGGKSKETAPNRNSKHSFCVELNKVIDASDVVLEVLDARDPLGSRCPQLEEAVLQRGGNKKLLFVLNKIDLVPRDNVEKWIQCLQKELPVVAFKASQQMRDTSVKARKRRLMASNDIVDLSRAATCSGNSCLMKLLQGFAANLPEEATLRVGVVGFPNVGKSSIINSLKGVLACIVGLTKGVTKSMQEVYISKNIKLIDSPGIVMPPSSSAECLALRGLQEEEDLHSMQEAIRVLLKQCDSTQIMLQYMVPDFRNAQEFLTLFAKRRGFLQKGGLPNTELSASTFLSDWTGAKLSYHCKVPESLSLPSYLSDAVVAEMHNSWDLETLTTGNQETLKGVRCTGLANSISFTSKGPTAGLLSVAEVPKDAPKAAASEGEAEQNDENDEHDDNDGPEQTEEQDEAEEEKPEKTVKKKTNSVRFQSVPIDIKLSTAMADDAYDFNTDYK